MTITPEHALDLLSAVEADLLARAPSEAVNAADGSGLGERIAAAAEDRRQFNLRRVRLAYERLRAGEYGYCQSCGEGIELARIEAEPLAPTCGGCAAQRAI